MVFELKTASLEDIDEIAHIQYVTYKDDIFMVAAVGNVDPVVVQDWYKQYFKRTFAKPGTRYFKVVDTDTGKIASFSKWRYPHAPLAEEEDELSDIPPPEGANLELFKAHFGRAGEMQRKYIELDKNYFLHALATLPEYERRGLGSLLLKHGMALADADGAKTYLEASPAGFPLYRRLGWTQIDQIVTDLGQYGGSGIRTSVCMIREPQKVAGN